MHLISISLNHPINPLPHQFPMVYHCWHRPILGKNKGSFEEIKVEIGKYKAAPENRECTRNRGKAAPETKENKRWK